MKAMLQFIAVAICAAVLVACGGGKKTTDDDTVVQPAYKMTESVVGSGLTAEAGDLVTFTFDGYLYDATKSDFRGTKVQGSGNGTYTATVGVGAMITGWDQTLLGMKPGGKRSAIVPDNLAYGDNAILANTYNGVAYPAVPANSAFVYDFTMVNISKKVTIPSVAAPTVTTITEVATGTGTAVAANGNTVTVRYTGWLYDGTRANFKGTSFDNNLSSTDPLSVVIGSGSVITGFNTTLIGMKVGGKRTVIIPPADGYGTTVKYDSSGLVTIPASSTLVFDIEMISIK